MEYFEGTKGKWEVVHNSFVNDVKCEDATIATVFNNGGLSAGEANAQLISAAPELLDAALSAWVLLSDIPEEFMDDFNKKVVRELDSSISKALGYKIGKK